MRAALHVPLLVLCAAGCAEHPADPPTLEVERMVLLDPSSRDRPVFTDTSAPSDCSAPEAQGSPGCQGGPGRDRFSPQRSPPTPDAQIRVVFNQVPTGLGRDPLETITQSGPMKGAVLNPLAIELTCANCTGVPPLTTSLQLSGWPLVIDADGAINGIVYPYGPALQVLTGVMDPIAVLEPETQYSVRLHPDLVGRAGAPLRLSTEGLRLLNFTTEPMRVLQVGIGDTYGDPWVYASTVMQDGSAAKPYQVSGLAANGVVALRLNAPVDDTLFKPTSATATVNGTGVPLKLGINELTYVSGKYVCSAGAQRTIYFIPDTKPNLTWGMTAGTLQLTLNGLDVHDLSQASGHPPGQGRHTLKSTISIRAALTGQLAGSGYTGITSDTVFATADCPK